MRISIFIDIDALAILVLVFAALPPFRKGKARRKTDSYNQARTNPDSQRYIDCGLKLDAGSYDIDLERNRHGIGGV
jgi:hypothetical protein